MTGFDQVTHAARAVGLGVVGAFHAEPEDLVAEGIESVVLLGPDGPDMWQAFTSSPEHGDGAAHGMDRWSHRVISILAEDLGAEAAFPFSGPPWMPFQRWAAKGENAIASPVSMQASPTRGLWASYRGALLFDHVLDLPKAASPAPCSSCTKPCHTACPVGAFHDGVYDIPKCVAHVTSDHGADCKYGCLVRRACPAGQALDLPQAQRAFHMAAFLRTHT